LLRNESVNTPLRWMQPNEIKARRITVIVWFEILKCNLSNSHYNENKGKMTQNYRDIDYDKGCELC